MIVLYYMKFINKDLAKQTRSHFTDKEFEMVVKTFNWTKNLFLVNKKKNKKTVGGHDFDHVYRVTGMAITLAISEKVSPFLPAIAAILHDVGRTGDNVNAVGPFHGKLSRDMSSQFIHQLGLSINQIKVLEDAIEDHPYLNMKVRPSKVIEILQDADRLDGLGALGPVRSGAAHWDKPIYNRKISNSSEELQIITIYQDFSVRIPEWYDMLWTKSARKIAKARYKFLMEFCEEFKKEAELMEKGIRDLNLYY